MHSWAARAFAADEAAPRRLQIPQRERNPSRRSSSTTLGTAAAMSGMSSTRLQVFLDGRYIFTDMLPALDAAFGTPTPGGAISTSSASSLSSWTCGGRATGYSPFREGHGGRSMSWPCRPGLA